MLENNSYKRPIRAIALAALVLFSAGSYGIMNQNAAAGEQELDSFGIETIYPTKQGGNEWYVNMDDPRSTLENIRNVEFEKNSDGSWQVYARQIRMEAWSPSNEKWHNVEITMYAKIEGGTSNDLLQMYSRGGHHSSRDPCSGSAYKARLYEDGRAAWTKEVTHPAYARNKGVVQAIDNPLEDRWVGFKAVIYNFVENGNTYVRLESYVDDNVTDENGNLVIGNNWELASVVEDRGGWGTPDGDFASHCGIARDAILAGPGGSGDQNIVAWRSDNTEWSFKYLSAREIDPLGEYPEPQPEPEPAPEEEAPEGEVPEEGTTDLSGYVVAAGQHVESDGITTISSVDLKLKKLTSRSHGTALVAIVQDGKVLATGDADTSALSSIEFSIVSVNVGASVQGSFDVALMYQGTGTVMAATAGNYIAGNYFDKNGERPDYDLDVKIS